MLTTLHNINQRNSMSTHPTILSSGTITVGEISLPVYQFSQTNYALPVRTVLQFLELKNYNLSADLKFLVAINAQTNLFERFIIIDENFVIFLIELSQRKHHFQATAMLQSFAMHGLELCIRHQNVSIDQNRDLATSDLELQAQSPYKNSDSTRFNTELKLDPSLALETESFHVDHLQKIKERNQELLNLLDEWNNNPDHELDRTWDEVMASL